MPKVIVSRITLLVVLLLAAAGWAQVDNTAILTGTAGASEIQLSAVLAITNPDTTWVGWAVVRDAVGQCVTPTVVHAEDGFPATADPIVFTDANVADDVTYRYRLLAVDDAGDTHDFGAPPAANPVWERIVYASLGNDGPVAMGQLVDLGWGTGIDLCPGQCWQEISFIGDVPPDLAALVGTGATVVLFGTLDIDFEGTYVSNIASWEQVNDCDAVADAPQSWSRLKASYR